jgi:hypothetical protein
MRLQNPSHRPEANENPQRRIGPDVIGRTGHANADRDGDGGAAAIFTPLPLCRKGGSHIAPILEACKDRMTK